MCILMDHRQLNLDKLTMADIDVMSHHFIKLDDRLGGGKCALVTNRDVDFGIARAWELMTGDQVAMQLYVFRSMEKAHAWLSEMP